MTRPPIIIFSFAVAFYCLTWVYIRQLVREVNANPGHKQVSLWRWLGGWNRHRSLYPTSVVRKRLVGCIAVTVALGLVVLVIEAHHMFARLN